MVVCRTMFTALVASLLACGSEVSYNREEPVLPPDAAPPLEACTEPLLVPRGPCWVGAMHWQGGKLVPNECDDAAVYSSAAPGFRVTVPDFFLDTDEVTNACYAHCVDAGTCAPPKPATREAPAWNDDARRQYPARLLDRAMAEAFCAWRGGRLPSLAELGRAEHGGAVAVMNADLTQLWRDCAAEPKPEECGEIYDRIYGEPTPVRDWELDRGPYGHYDLALSALEITMTHMFNSKDEHEALCSLSLNPDAIDPKTLGSGRNMGFRPGGNLWLPIVEGPGENAGWIITGDPLEGGVRCAYDPI
jgi:formylglycine-generating enzyme required for sulfatase activity